MTGLQWYILVAISLAIWYALCAFVIQPALVWWHFRRLMRSGALIPMIAEYLEQLLQSKRTLKAEDGKEYEVTLFQEMVNAGFEIAWFRVEQRINSYKSAISRATPGELDTNPVFQGMSFMLPKKYKGFAPVLFQGLQSYFTSKTEKDNKKGSVNKLL